MPSTCIRQLKASVNETQMGGVALPPEVTILEEVTGRPEFKNKYLAKCQQL